MLQLYLKEVVHPNDLIAFTSKNSSEKSQKIDSEAFYSTEEYKRKLQKLVKISDYFESIDQSILIEDQLTSKHILEYLLDLILENQVYVREFQISIPENELSNLHRNYPLLKVRNLEIKINDDKFIIERVRLEILNKIPKRIFCNCTPSSKSKCFHFGGRLYGQTFSYLKKELRKNFHLGDERLFGEYDFSALHPRILFYLSGQQPLADDLYALDLFPELEKIGEVAQRKLVKKALLVAINAKSFTSAKIAFKRFMMNNCPEMKSITDKTLNAIFDKVINATQFTPIRQYFFTNKGIECQLIDSDIITDSLSDLSSKDIPVISLHDSLFFTTRDENEMKMIQLILEKNYRKHVTKALKSEGKSEDEIQKLRIFPDLKFKPV